LQNLSDWQLDGNIKNEGMMIYNTNEDVPGGNGKDIYVWTRNSWKPVGPVTLKRFSLDKSILFLLLDGETGTITAQNFTGSNDLPFDDVTVTWSIAAGDVPEGASVSYDDNTATIIPGSTAGSFTVQAAAGGITYDCSVRIIDCTGVTDVEDNAYSTGLFGEAGCWMTQNLRTKTYADGATALTQGSNTDPASKFYNYPNNDAAILTTHSEYGLLYTWAAATNRAATSANEANRSDQTQYQGICPNGWHLPSDYEWLQLEEVIAKSAAGVYSTTGATAWETSYSALSVNPRGGHGRKMKSATAAVNGTSPGGTSHAHTANGFDALLVGYTAGGTNTASGNNTTFVSSSSVNAGSCARVMLHQTSVGAEHNSQPKYVLRSVRCKKD
jgi:uncharacterized protein (TIGR02145 family)